MMSPQKAINAAASAVLLLVAGLHGPLARLLLLLLSRRDVVTCYALREVEECTEK
jgi:hypothetical protein